MDRGNGAPQIAVLDAGGQYCHLIARKIRDLGVSSEVRPSETPAEELRGCKGIVISGGPGSVYESGSPRIDPEILRLPHTAVLGICYGLQLMAREMGGGVRKGEKGEYGMAVLHRVAAHDLLAGLNGETRVWMSHRDVVEEAPPGFDVLATTGECPVAAMAHRSLPLTGLQFHPEVVHTERGQEIYSNFLFRICGCEKDWDPRGRIPGIERSICETTAGRKVFFFVSGGVDSTVAYTLCLRALGAERVYGVYVDTGLMREGETEFVREIFADLGATAFRVEDASESFLRALDGVCEPEEKRKRIGEEFVNVQERILGGGFFDGHWILGQGTIYPDTIESGGSAKADLIKTHHNRVAGIQKLIEEGRIVEPLASFYKDEVREIGGEIGIPEPFLSRHPFPGPGLAIRCLCTEGEAATKRVDEGWIVPVRSVGVQGDSRSYRSVLLIDGSIHEKGIRGRATALVNRSADYNRVVALCGAAEPVESLGVTPGSLSPERLERLRRADAIVRALSASHGFDGEVWQFPVILIPFGSAERPDSVVLRPVHSVDGMTAESVPMPEGLLEEIVRRTLGVGGVCTVLYDLTHKPPGTIEWE